MGLLKLLLPVALIGALVWLIRRAFDAAPVGAEGCATCRHCRKEFEDGTLCAFGNREVFKKPVHVKNCTDYQRRA